MPVNRGAESDAVQILNTVVVKYVTDQCDNYVTEKLKFNFLRPISQSLKGCQVRINNLLTFHVAQKRRKCASVVQEKRA
ncbi:hypothetical protein AwEntero_19890 [Enterobacterales bacterium]|nr:hypothetical protein AwEntero_19890 [Enterobacterales bacterium]